MAAKKKPTKKPSPLARMKSERDEAERMLGVQSEILGNLRQEVAESEARRKHWCEVAIAREQRAELAEDALRALLEASQRSRPSVPLVIAQAPQLDRLETLGEPGDGPTGRYCREVRP